MGVGFMGLGLMDLGFQVEGLHREYVGGFQNSGHPFSRPVFEFAQYTGHVFASRVVFRTATHGTSTELPGLSLVSRFGGFPQIGVPFQGASVRRISAVCRLYWGPLMQAVIWGFCRAMIWEHTNGYLQL